MSKPQLSRFQTQREIFPLQVEEFDLNAQLQHLQSATSDFSVLTEELRHLHQNDEYWYAMGSRLQKISNERLYRNGGFKSFSEYCSRGLGYSRQHVYKLIKVVQFIDDLWRQASTPENRERAYRMFKLSFTKLYFLHSLPEETLLNLLEEGVPIVSGDDIKRWLPLEMVTIGQLKRSLMSLTKGDAKPVMPIPSVKSPVRSLAKMIGTQAQNMLLLIENCRRDFDSQEQLNERLDAIGQFAQNIVEGINALAGTD